MREALEEEDADEPFQEDYFLKLHIVKAPKWTLALHQLQQAKVGTDIHLHKLDEPD